jgi:3-phenylpropionate/trans-cinnamate dioxygenase ferredoxin subunit
MDWIKACDTNALKVGDVLRVESAVGPVAVFRLNDGFFATQDTCTHAIASLSDGYVDDGTIECPMHAGKFCIRTGAVKSLPATEALVTFPTRQDVNTVWIGVAEHQLTAP